MKGIQTYHYRDCLNVTAQVDFNYTNPQSFQYFIRGGGLRYRYNLEQLHFHWGSVSTHGSEHTFGSRSYALEVSRPIEL